VNKNPILAPAE